MGLSLAGFSAGVVALLLANSAAVAEQKAVELDYQIWTGGLQAMNLETKMFRGQERYQVDVTVESVGMLGRFFPFKLSARSQGMSQFGNLNELQPDQYDVRSTWRDQDRLVAISYEDATKPKIEVLPPAEDDDRDPVPMEQIVGTVDPVSAALALIEQTAAQGRCQGEVPVFDGRRRYNMVVRHIGPAVVSPSDYSPYAGDAAPASSGSAAFGTVRRPTSTNTTRSGFSWRRSLRTSRRCRSDWKPRTTSSRSSFTWSTPGSATAPSPPAWISEHLSSSLGVPPRLRRLLRTPRIK